MNTNARSVNLSGSVIIRRVGPVGSALSAALLLLLTQNIRASFIPAADNVGQVQGSIGEPANYTIGYNFTVGATPITIDALGLDSGTGNLAHGGFPAVPVHLWQAGTTTDLALALIDDADSLSVPISGGVAYYYASIAPLALAANTTYVIGATLPTAGQGAVFAGPTITDPRISLGAPVSGLDPYPSANDAGLPEYFGPSFEIAPVPEPVCGAVFGLGAGFASLVLRRRRG